MCDKINLDYYKKYSSYFESVTSVLEVGSYNVNGNFREIVLSKNISYLGIDIEKGPGVDLVCDVTSDFEILHSKLDYKKYDLVICTNVLEHLYNPLSALNNIVKLMNDNGYLMLITPLVWELHNWPADYIRLNPDFYKRFCTQNNLEIIPETFQLSLPDSKLFFNDTTKIPTILENVYTKGWKRFLLHKLSKHIPELRMCWAHTYLNFICKKIYY